MIKTVTEITQLIKNILESDVELQSLYVEGEISNWKRHTSGHVYFTLKDEYAQLPAVWFNAPIFTFKDGDLVLAIGRINVYPPQGRYQLIVQALQPRGRGALYQQFLLIKERLQSEGLFDSQHKKSIPRTPKVIGVITSPTGAVIQDIIKTLNRRYPYTRLLILPAIVQGEEAVPSLLRAFSWVELLPEIEVVILARGGGSFEDLWCFNAPELAYAIFDCTRPVITAIGHETDTTIADMVADLRAPTPTAAAELVSRDVVEMQETLVALNRQLQKVIRNAIYYQYQRLDGHRYKLDSLLKVHTKNQQSKVAFLRLAVQAAVTKPLSQQRMELAKLKEQLYQVLRRSCQKQKYKIGFCSYQLIECMQSILGYNLQQLQGYQQKLDSLFHTQLKERLKKVAFLHLQIHNLIVRLFQKQLWDIQRRREQLVQIMGKRIESQKRLLYSLKASLEKHNMGFLLQSSFSVTLKEGKLLSDPSTLRRGEQIETLLKGYSILSRVEEINLLNGEKKGLSL